MRLSLCLSITSAAIGYGCGSNPNCGIDNAPDTIVASGTGVTLTYGDFAGGLNHDCPDPAAPPGEFSYTIESTQTDGTGRFTLCIPRIDQLGSGDHQLGTSTSTAEARVIDATGSMINCTFRLDAAHPPTGTVSATGVCGNGSDSRGFALTIDGQLALTRTCGTTVDSVTVTLSGPVAVLPM
jgi:hypothetical protein